MASNNKFYRVNDKIRFSPVLVIGPDGDKIGVIPTQEARQKAIELGLDLVEIAPDARPPVCRIIDFNKFKYEQSLREKEQRKKQKNNQLKEIWLRPNIAKHDLDVKINAVRRFLESGSKVKVGVQYQKREIAHKELGVTLLKNILESIKELGSPIQQPRFEGKDFSCIIDPTKPIL